MTLILGVEDPAARRAFVFADTGIWRKGDHSAQSAYPKLWRDGEWICGCAGDWELAQATQRTRFAAAGETDLSWLTDWQKDVYRECGAVAALVKGVASDSQFSTPSVIAARGALVYDLEDCGVARTELGWSAAGYWIYAVAAMSAIEHVAKLSPFDAGIAVMRSVARITDNVRAPFRWLCTDGASGGFE